MTTSEDEFLRKAAGIKGLIIQHPKFKQVHSQLHRSYVLGSQYKSPRNIFIYGPTGVGKSTVHKHFTSTFTPRDENAQRIVPVLSVTLPSPAYAGSLATAMLKALGEPNYKRGSIEWKKERVLELLRDCQVGLLIIDEVQHFIRKTSGDASLDTKNWLKNLVEQAGVSMAMIGSDQSLILLDEKELDRRFDVKIQLEPFLRKEKDDALVFRGLLNEIEKDLDLPEPSNLAEPDLAQRILVATNGILGYLTTLIREALMFSMMEEKRRIDRNSLRHAFELVHRAKHPNCSNPFDETFDWRSLTARGQPFENLTDAGNKSRTKPKKVPSQSSKTKEKAA